MSRWYWAIEIASDINLPLQNRRDLLECFAKLWIYQNPYLHGPNWKCGQEVSLRLTHFLVAMRLLGYSPNDLSPSQNQFVTNHLRRIKPTLSYAKGQKNNHWISEAVGLIIGGLWLGNQGNAKSYYHKGIQELHGALNDLFNNDGSFAQSSFNYLRHALTLVAIAKLEISKNGLDCSIFESIKLSNALNFFDQFYEPLSSTTHNWGANDGSNPLAISQNEFLDPSAHKCFFDFSFKGIPIDTENNVVSCLINTYSQYKEVTKKHVISEIHPDVGGNFQPGFKEFPDGGLVFYRNEIYRALVRLPNFNFKPSQDDVGHIDVIYKGVGSLLDCGTYSYFIDDSIFEYFQGVQSHNTLYRAAEKYSMRKLSRFVFGSWTKGCWTIIGEDRLVLEFKNIFSDHFQRTFDFKKDRIIVRDKVVKSTSTDLISGLTLNSNLLVVSSESSCEIITTKPEIETSGTFAIRSNTPAVIRDVPVSFCYGEKVYKKRVEFSMKNKELMFEICFQK
ncbi:heparinase II/III family protein [Alphaproteobacteria bacterium]|nr:heparinase II/III family protein [Alphaproteobacteria bacterium]